jgi:DNA-binding NarL/FixJ family response regulator
VQLGREPVRTVVAEDLTLLRDGLIMILEAHGFEVVESVDNAAALARALRRSDIDLAVVDVRMPPTQTNEGLLAAIEARRERPGLPVVVLSQYVESIYARELLAGGEGAVGYLLKDRVVDVANFVESIHQVLAGGIVLDPKVVSSMLGRVEREQPVQRLTAREREVLGLMAEGRSNRSIASQLFVTEKAVDKHTNSIFAKLDLPMAPDDNRRVLAVLAWLQDAG